MSTRYPRSPISTKSRTLAYEQRLVKQVLWVLVLAILAGLGAGVMATWDRWVPSSPEQVITVYWTHNCKCVFGWIDSLKAAGFDVKSFEYETLKYERASLRIPSNLHGCHVGTYLGYFIEGHVTPDALRQLQLEHPPGRGLVTQAVLSTKVGASSSYTDEDSPVLLMDDTGQARRWFTEAQ